MNPSAHDPLAAARQARDEVARRAAEPPVLPAAPGGAAIEDPFRLCTYTTLALLAWIFGAPVILALFALLGLAAYARALRRGLLRSRCFLRDTRLTLVYLAVLALAALAWIAWRLAGRFG